MLRLEPAGKSQKTEVKSQTESALTESMEEQIEIEKELQNFDDRTFQFDDNQEIAEDLDLDLVEQEVGKFESAKQKAQSNIFPKDQKEPEAKPKQLSKTASSEKFSSSSKLSNTGNSAHEASAGEHIDEVDDDEAIDEFIKRHLESETPKEGKF